MNSNSQNEDFTAFKRSLDERYSNGLRFQADPNFASLFSY